MLCVNVRWILKRVTACYPMSGGHLLVSQFRDGVGRDCPSKNSPCQMGRSRVITVGDRKRPS